MATPEVRSPLDLCGATFDTAAQPSRWDDWLRSSTCKALMYLAGDLVSLSLAYVLAWAVSEKWFAINRAFLVPTRSFPLFFLPLTAGVLYLVNAYRSHDLRRPEKELELAFKGLTFSFLVLVTANFVVFRSGLSRHLTVSWYVFSLPLLLASRFGIRALYTQFWKRGLAQQRTLLIGTSEESDWFREILSLQRHQGNRIVCTLAGGTLAGAEAENGAEPQLWRTAIDSGRIDVVVVCAPRLVASRELASDILPYCRERKVAVEVYSGLFNVSECENELDEFSGFLCFRARPAWRRLVQRSLKVVLDRSIGLIGSAATLLITPFFAAVIKLDGGPVFYRSAYLGQDRRLHYYLKFRTMCPDADALLQKAPELKGQFERKFKLEEDPRVTRFGRIMRKYSLDEFPQFFSVLLGKLSFVGPRTIRQEEGFRYGELLPKLLTVKPGVTGFWQVMGRQTTSYEERIKLDMFYIDHWSLWLDLTIIVKTLWKVVGTEGAY